MPEVPPAERTEFPRRAVMILSSLRSELFVPRLSLTRQGILHGGIPEFVRVRFRELAKQVEGLDPRLAIGQSRVAVGVHRGIERSPARLDVQRQSATRHRGPACRHHRRRRSARICRAQVFLRKNDME
jgi:hypothetical protein